MHLEKQATLKRVMLCSLPQVNEDACMHLARLPTLQFLGLEWCDAPKCFQLLRESKSLERLFLNQGETNNEWIKQLDRLTQLKRLGIKDKRLDLALLARTCPRHVQVLVVYIDGTPEWKSTGCRSIITQCTHLKVLRIKTSKNIPVKQFRTMILDKLTVPETMDVKFYTYANRKMGLDDEYLVDLECK